MNRLPGGTAASIAGIERLAGRAGGVSVVDIGTGRADMPVAFARRGWRSLAVDSNPEVLRIARAATRGTPQIDVVEADALHLPLPDGGVDVAHCSLLIHHLDATEAVAVLREMARVARLGVVVNDLRRGVLPLAITAATRDGLRAHPRDARRRHRLGATLVHPARAGSPDHRCRIAADVAITADDAPRRDGRGAPMTPADVVVVGAGPAGSAAAAGLARAGARVVLVEASRHPRPKACAEYASPRIVEELMRIGLAPAAWRSLAVALEGMEIHAGGRAVRIRYADRHGNRHAWGVDRRTFDQTLAHHAVECGAELRDETRVTDVVRAGSRVTGVRVRSGRGSEVIGATHVVGADGARSTLAHLLGVERPVRFPRRLGLVAHHAGVDGLADHGEMHVGDGYYVGLAPTPNGELNVGMALPLDGSGSAGARFERAIAGLPAVARRLAGSSRLSPIRGAAPIGHRVSEVAGPGWLLVGDAAGFVDPFTGEGIHRALRSARAATEAIIGEGDVGSSYRGERRRAFAAKAALSWVVQGFLAAPPLLEHAVARLERRPEAALRLGSALGDCRPATDALSPRAVLEVIGP